MPIIVIYAKGSPFGFATFRQAFFHFRRNRDRGFFQTVMKHSVRGGITCILGPMFSGKTTELLRLHDRQSIAKKNCILVKYAGDTRYDENLVATHTKVTGQGNTVKCSRLEEVRAALFDSSIDVVSIDEGQFFPDLAATCDQLAEAGKRVYVAALSGTFERKAFPQITILLPFCDDIELLSAVCSCGTDACYTFRCTKDKKIEIIGGQDAYMALCRSCFNLKSLERDRDEIAPGTPQDHTTEDKCSVPDQDQKYTEIAKDCEIISKSEGRYAAARA